MTRVQRSGDASVISLRNFSIERGAYVMIGFDIKFVGEHDTIDWPAANVSSHVTNDLAVAVLDKGMQTGRPSCMLRVPLTDGTVAIVETSARVWCAVATAIMAKYPDLLKGD